MSFISITPEEIVSGKPVSADTQTKVKNNFDDHEERLQNVEASTSNYPPIILRVNGAYGVYNGVVKTTVNSAVRITGVRILVDDAGTSGTLEIDIQKKSGANPYTSILTTLPSVAYTAGDDALSSNAILDPSKVDLVAGDILRLDITSAQMGSRGFLVRIDYNLESE